LGNNVPKTPRDLATEMKLREPDGFCHETFRVPRSEARRRAKQLFRQFPSATYMTEIETWRELPDDVIEFTMKRLKDSIDELG
jgi:hypothetical protein